MESIDQLLVVLNGSRDEFPELEKIASLAQKIGARVTLLLVVYNASLDSHYWFDQEGKHGAQASYCKGFEARIQKEVGLLLERGVTAQASVVWSKRLHEAVTDHCQNHSVDWVVKACDQHSFMEKMFFTHSDWHLIREVNKPLWLIKKLGSYQQPLLAVAVDPTKSHDKPTALDIELIESGKALAQCLDGRVKVMHAYDPIPPTLLTDIGSAAAQEITEQIVAQHRKAFIDLMTQHGIPEDQQHLVEDDVHHALPAWLRDQGVDLLLIGAVQRSKINQWLLGSTAERLLESVETDFLVLKPGSDGV